MHVWNRIAPVTVLVVYTIQKTKMSFYQCSLLTYVYKVDTTGATNVEGIVDPCTSACESTQSFWISNEVYTVKPD